MNMKNMKKIVQLSSVATLALLFAAALSCSNPMDTSEEIKNDFLKEDTTDLTIDFSEGEDGSGVTKDLSLPKEINGTSVSWASSDPSVIEEDGTVHRPPSNGDSAQITLTAILSREGITQAKDFTLTVHRIFRVEYSASPYEAEVNGTIPQAHDAGSDDTATAKAGTDLERAGYTFVGWNSAQDGTGNGYKGGESFTLDGRDFTLYAQWTQDPTYTITYDGNGQDSGSVPTDDKNYLENETVTVADSHNLSRSEYRFAGWIMESDPEETLYTSGDTFSIPARDVTLVAKWLPTYTITYNGNGNDSGSSTVPTEPNRYAEGEEVTLAEVGSMVLTGYSFEEWNMAQDGMKSGFDAGTTMTMPGEDVDLYAQWTEGSYTLSYNGNGHTSGAVSESVGASYNETIVLASQEGILRIGYSFSGWNTDPAGGSETHYDAGSTFLMPAGDEELFAEWTVNEYTVTYHANADGNHTGSVPSSGTYYYASEVTTALQGDLSLDGYHFAGWGTSAENPATVYPSDSIFSMPAENVNLYAQWTIVPTYQVLYDSNAGDLGTISGTAPNDPTAYYESDVAEVLAPGDLALTGYIFDSWNAAEGGGGATLYPGDELTIGTQDETLYAQWTPKAYSLVYYGNDHTSGTPPLSVDVDYNSTVTVSDRSDLERAGFSFGGWNGRAEGEGVDYPVGFDLTMPLGGEELYAKWINDVPCSEVDNLQAEVGDGEVTLTWDDPPESDLDAIMINGKSVSIPSIEVSQSEIDSGQQTVTITGLHNWMEYTFIVSNVDTAGNKTAGLEITAMPYNSHIYVSNDGDSNLHGDPTYPTDDISYALDMLTAKGVTGGNVHVSAGAYNVDELIQLTDDVSIKGGYDSSDWAVRRYETKAQRNDAQYAVSIQFTGSRSYQSNGFVETIRIAASSQSLDGALEGITILGRENSDGTMNNDFEAVHVELGAEASISYSTIDGRADGGYVSRGVTNEGTLTMMNSVIHGGNGNRSIGIYNTGNDSSFSILDIDAGAGSTNIGAVNSGSGVTFSDVDIMNHRVLYYNSKGLENSGENVLVDGCSFGSDGNSGFIENWAVDNTGASLTITNSQMSEFEYGVESTADGLTVDNVSLSDFIDQGDTFGISSTGTSSTIKNCTFSKVPRPIAIEGGSAVVEGNSIPSWAREAISVTGDGASIKNNSLTAPFYMSSGSLTYDHKAMELSGNDLLISGNSLDDNINDAETEIYSGIDVDGSQGTIRSNSIQGTGISSAIGVSGDNFLIENNYALAGGGLSLWGHSNTSQNNTWKARGTGLSVSASSSGDTVVQNETVEGGIDGDSGVGVSLGSYVSLLSSDIRCGADSSGDTGSFKGLDLDEEMEIEIRDCTIDVSAAEGDASYGIYVDAFSTGNVVPVYQSAITAGSATENYGIYVPRSKVIVHNSTIHGGSGDTNTGIQVIESAYNYIANTTIRCGGTGTRSSGIVAQDASFSSVNNTIDPGDAALTHNLYLSGDGNGDHIVNNIFIAGGGSDSYGVYEDGQSYMFKVSYNNYSGDFSVHYHDQDSTPYDKTSVEELNNIGSINVTEGNVIVPLIFEENYVITTDPVPASVADGGLVLTGTELEDFPKNEGGGPTDKNRTVNRSLDSNWSMGVYEY